MVRHATRIGVLMALLVVLLPGCAGGPPPQDTFAENWRGKSPEAFELDLIDGSTFDLEPHLGSKVIVLNFFGTWCPPCRAELPALDRIYHESSGRMLLLGISLNEEESAVDKFMNNLNLDFPVGIDPRRQSGSVSEQYEVPTVPTTVIIGYDGTIQYYKPGMLRDYDFTYLRDLINEKHQSPG